MTGLVVGTKERRINLDNPNQIPLWKPSESHEHNPYRFRKDIEYRGKTYSVDMYQSDIESVLSRFFEFFVQNGVFGDALQQNSDCHVKMIDMVCNSCDFDFKIMEE